VYDGNADMKERLSFGSWGNRRDFATLTALPPYNTDFTSVTTRGYTGHEHGDAFGIIHMNGRIYDPTLGRMLQADPFIDGVTNTQGYNRYSYVGNNPLSYTDPSGYFKLKEILGPVDGVALSVWAPWGTGIWHSFTYGAIGGGVGAGANGGNVLQGAMTGGISAAAFTAVAVGFGELGTPVATATNTIRAGEGLYLSGGNFAGLVAAQGAVGGVMAELQGGNFGHGFLSAGITKLATPGILSFDNILAESVASGIVGGTVSELTGGKFANGASTGAFLYAFNAGASRIVTRGLKGLWGITPHGTSAALKAGDGRKYYESAKDGTWWSVDTAGHGSAWKVYKRDGDGLHWISDADEYGQYILDKHKGDSGMFISNKNLSSTHIPNRTITSALTVTFAVMEVLDFTTYIMSGSNHSPEDMSEQ
jgi:RHS repeat-associated protein